MTTSIRKRNSDRPETPRQARTFDHYKRHYVRLGLCRVCAAQAAFGHQLGFSRSKPPCNGCLAVVDSFPMAEPNDWRSSSPRRGVAFSPAIASRSGRATVRIRTS